MFDYGWSYFENVHIMLQFLQLLHPLLNDVLDFRLCDHQDFLMEEHDNKKTSFCKSQLLKGTRHIFSMWHQFEYRLSLKISQIYWWLRQFRLTCFSVRSSSAEVMLWLRCSLTVHNTQIHIWSERQKSSRPFSCWGQIFLSRWPVSSTSLCLLKVDDS